MAAHALAPACKKALVSHEDIHILARVHRLANSTILPRQENMKASSAVVGVLCASTTCVSAFVVTPSAFAVVKVNSGSTAATRTVTSMSDEPVSGDRRLFLSKAATGVAAALGLGVVGSSAAFADVSGSQPANSEDRPTPTKSPVSEEDERIARKLEAQSKVLRKSGGGKMSYSESRSNEAEKQAKMATENSDKEKRREALCEQLGRGC